MLDQFSKYSLTVLTFPILEVINLAVELVIGECRDVIIIVVVVDVAAVCAFAVVVLHAVFVLICG